MKGLAILGSTGSIGMNALSVVAEHPEEFRVMGLAAGRNAARLAEQVRRFRPAVVAVETPEVATELEARLKGETAPEILVGQEGAQAVATLAEVDLVLSAMVGAVGLAPTYAAILAGKDVALANKETLVAAGSLVMQAVKEHGVALIPVDSEHSAIFQALHGHPQDEVRSLWLTASGGPFRTWSREQLAAATPKEALKHPNWAMGAKITIDSATMMNKALEVIEAAVLFGLPPERIRVFIHPQSIIHSLVEFVDGSVLAQLGWPDMRLPIAYALTYPRRLPLNGEPLDLTRVAQLTFEVPDTERFPALALGYEAAAIGGTMPAVLNAANEVAVAAFLAGRLPFLGIPRVVADTMAAHQPEPLASLEQVLSVNDWARGRAEELVRQTASSIS